LLKATAFTTEKLKPVLFKKYCLRFYYVNYMHGKAQREPSWHSVVNDGKLDRATT